VEGGPELVRLVWRRGALRIFAANFVGSVLVVAYYNVAPTPNGRGHGAAGDVVLLVVFTVVIALLHRWAFLRKTADAWSWLLENRPSTSREREAVLRVPAVVFQLNIAAWAAVSVLSTALNYWSHSSITLALRVTVGIALAGVVASFLATLLAERTMRPVFVGALAGQPPERANVVGIRRRLLLFWALGSGIPLLGVILTPLGLPPGHVHQQVLAMAALAAIGLLSGAAFLVVAAASVADPVANVRDAMQRVARGDLDTEVPVDDDGEIGLLQAGFNHMASGLREREQLRELFGGYVGQEVARRALESGVSLEGEERDVSVLFVDVLGSTALAERRPPVEVVALLNRFFDAVIRVVDGEDGWVNKFEGDAALCVFGAPVDQPDHAARALRAAVALRNALRALEGLDAGIGVSSGTAVAGNVGSERRYEYTVVGDPVNEAARLTELAKSHAGRIVVSDRTVQAAGSGGDGWRPGECIILRGRSQPTQTFVPG
jgi:adenylate cyclase